MIIMKPLWQNAGPDIDIDFDLMFSILTQFDVNVTQNFKISTLNLIQCSQCFNVDFNLLMLQFFQILSTFSNNRKLTRVSKY